MNLGGFYKLHTTVVTVVFVSFLIYVTSKLVNESNLAQDAEVLGVVCTALVLEKHENSDTSMFSPDVILILKCLSKYNFRYHHRY